MSNPFGTDEGDLYTNPFASSGSVSGGGGGGGGGGGANPFTSHDDDDSGLANYTYKTPSPPPPAPAQAEPTTFWKASSPPAQEQTTLWKASSPVVHAAPNAQTEAEIMAIAKQKQELMLREEAQEQQRQALAASQAQNAPQPPATYDPNAPKVKNFPFFYPITYHSIKDDIPPESRRTVLTLYYSWMFTIVCYVVNMAACLCILIAGSSGGAADFGYSIMYVVLLTPVSFFSHYKPVYNAFRSNSSFWFNLFFFFGFWHVAWMIYVIVGMSGSGSAGFINCIALFAYDNGSHHAEAFVVLVALLLWIINAATFVLLYYRVRTHYSKGGLSIEQARNEAITSAASNPQVQQAAVGAASQAATSYASSQWTAAQHGQGGQYGRQVDEV